MRTRLNQILAAGTPVALLVLGLDHFKEVNFSFGYQLGNRLLARVADRLGRMLAPEQQLARLDGDLFALVLPGVADQQAAMAVARRALRTLELPVSIDTESLTIGASIGVAFGPADGADADALLRCADVALDHAKQRHSGIEVFRATNDPFKPERLRLLSELPFAIEARQTFLCYQPKEDLVTGHIMGLEALVRWRHPTAGIVPPDEFIGYAEQRGLIGALTVAVLDEATHQIATWSRLGLNVPVAVNLSARSLHDPLLPDTICGLCETAGVPTSMLELEITESTVMADPNRAHDLLERLRERGILHIALDDFGTGYSSLAVLRKLPVNTLKLDRSFIKEMRSDPAAVAIVEAMVDLAHKLDKVVVAEGVEDDITRSLLRQIGCDQIQGYFLCKPLPAPDITQWLGRRQ
jgi:diguanylate cyclase (GGDEF)-like protein